MLSGNKLTETPTKKSNTFCTLRRLHPHVPVYLLHGLLLEQIFIAFSDEVSLKISRQSNYAKQCFNYEKLYWSLNKTSSTFTDN